MDGRGDVQYSHADVQRMTPEQIVAARQAGQLRDLLSGSPRAPKSDAPPVPQLTREDLADMTNDQIVEARRAGQLAEILGGEAPIAVDFSSYAS